MARKSSKTAHVINLLASGGAHDEALSDGEQQEEGLSVAKLVQMQSAAEKKDDAAAKLSALREQTVAEVNETFPALETQTEAMPPVQDAQPPILEENQPVDGERPLQQDENEPYELANIAEQAIAQKIDEVMQRMNACRCDVCKRDIVVLALNLVPARYLPLNKLHEEALSQYTAEYGREITAALVKSCIKVKVNPRH